MRCPARHPEGLARQCREARRHPPCWHSGLAAWWTPHSSGLEVAGSNRAPATNPMRTPVSLEAGLCIGAAWSDGRRSASECRLRPGHVDSLSEQADLILLNGANYAKWIGKVSLPRRKMVDTSRRFEDRHLCGSEVTTRSDGAAGAYAHEFLACTTRLDLSLARLHAESIYTALARKRPMSEMVFKREFQALADYLDGLHTQIGDIVARDSDRVPIGLLPGLRLHECRLRSGSKKCPLETG